MVTLGRIELPPPPWKGGVLYRLTKGAVTSQVAAWLSLRSDILKYYRQIISLSNQNSFFSELQDRRFSPARESNPPHFQLRNYPILCFSLGFEHKGNNCFPGDPRGIRTQHYSLERAVTLPVSRGDHIRRFSVCGYPKSLREFIYRLLSCPWTAVR